MSAAGKRMLAAAKEKRAMMTKGDHWKTTNPEDLNAPEPDDDDLEPWERSLSQCDCCGEMQYDCEDIVWRGMDTHACPACRGEKSEDR